ncbi:MAG TPA: carboxypeptidase regulatory-like domain-containing protein, partial [Verrucomicrobiae bacterium]
DITPLNNDPVCGKLNGGKVSTTFFVVGPDKGLADVVVMLKGVPAKAADASAAPVVMDQKGCLYEPQIVAVQEGQKLVVKNSDPASVPMHNVHINPTADANKEAFATKISQPQMSGGSDLTYDFTAPENFMKFQCDVHPWMFAWVTVVDNPYFAITDKSGKFTIKNVPAGKYKIVALHRKAAPTGMEKDVDVSGGNATVDFTLEVK